MNGLAAWVVLMGAALVTLLISVVHYTLRSPSRVRLEHAFLRRPRRSGGGGQRRLAFIDARSDELLLETAVVRVLGNLLIFLAMLHLVAGEHGLWRDLAAAAAAAGVIAVVGIAIPHAWAKYGGERTVAVLWPMLVAMWWCLWPLARALGVLDVPIRRLSGHEVENNGRTSEVEQEILQLASEGRAEGGLDAEEVEMISSVIEFHDIRAGEIMTPRTDIEALPVEASREHCVATILRVGHSRIPVYEGTLDSVVGLLYAKDLLGAGEKADFDLRGVMRKCYYVPETKAVSDLLREFKAQKVHIAIVLDEYGGTAGLVTIEDLLEEIVGEISDEYEEAEPVMLHRVDASTVDVDARMYIDDLNDELGIELPEQEDYDTVGGFAFSTLGYIPEAGEQFEHRGIRFTVLAAEPRKINRIRITLPETTAPGDEE